MNLSDLIHRQLPPAPWSEGDNIPWDQPAFSERMLLEHLSQAHDAASRRFERIDQQVAWIHRAILAEGPARVLDLACGPGLYSHRLARLGHSCTGIDFSPASIRYARATAADAGLDCAFQLGDLRQVDFGSGHRLALLIYGEFNVFHPSQVAALLAKARQALQPDGWLLLEPHTFEAVEKLGTAPVSWYTAPQGLFSAEPHLVLQENFWDDAARAATTRYFVIEAASATVTRWASSYQAYTEAEYRAILAQNGFGALQFYPSLSGDIAGAQEGFFVILAQKGGG
jgi:SAM-dependent methyltransferase